MNLGDRLAELDDIYLACRNRRHRYEDIPDDHRRLQKWVGKNVFRLCQRCERCTTVRYEAWNRFTGALLGSAYIHPTDYSVKGGAKPFQLRKEYIRRASQ